MVTTGGDLLARGLADLGVEVAFGLQGGHLDPLLVGCARLGIRLVDTRHEAPAVNAADAYGRVTGRLGVAFVTAGAGLSNALAGLGPAHVDRSATLVVTASPPRRDDETNTLQGFLDQTAMVRPLTRWTHRVAVAEDLPRLLGLAVRQAFAGAPGPVVLDVPTDLLFEEVEPAGVVRGGGYARGLPPAPAPEGVTAALDLLAAAERPVAIAGGGVRGPAPRADLVAFAEATGVPVFHPGMIMGAMPAGHPLNGWTAKNLAPLVSEGRGPDLAMLLGARFGFYLGGRGGSVVPLDAKVVEVDTDAGELGRLRPFDVGLVADAGQTLRALTAGAATRTWPDRTAWAAAAAGVQRRPSPYADEPAVLGDRLHPYHAVRDVLRALEPGATLVVDGGELSGWATMSLHEAAPHRTVGCGYLGYLGTSLGFAIGAQVGEPDRRVVVFVGDGGFGFHPQEFDTLVRHGLPIVVVVVNNASWAMSQHGQQPLFPDDKPVMVELHDTDYERVATGFGAFGARVHRPDEVARVVRRALDCGGPALVNLAVSPDVVHPMMAGMIDTVGAPTPTGPYGGSA